MAVDTTSLTWWLVGLRDKLLHHPDIELKAMYVFGSVTTITGSHEWSDVDIALFGPTFADYRIDMYEKLRNIARDVKSRGEAMPSDLVDRLQFHLYSDKDLNHPRRFVEHEVLKGGLVLYSDPKAEQSRLMSCVASHSLCDKCGRFWGDDHGTEIGCPASPHSFVKKQLFIIDLRYSQVLKDVDWILAELTDQILLGHFDHLEIALTAWSTLKNYVLNNVKQRLLNQFIFVEDVAPVVVTHFLRKPDKQFWGAIATKSWDDLSGLALQHKDFREFSEREECARKLRNSYAHALDPVSDGKLAFPKERREFLENVVTDFEFLLKPTVLFAVEIYKAALECLRDDLQFASKDFGFKLIFPNKRNCMDESDELENVLKSIQSDSDNQKLVRKRNELLSKLWRIEPESITIEQVLEDLSVAPPQPSE